MRAHLRPALVMTLLFTLLLGVAFPLGFVGLGQALMPFAAGGSILMHNGVPVGSALIGENFVGAKYFHPRPSATTAPDPKNPANTIAAPYNAANSNASNLAPSAKALIDRVKGDLALVPAAPVAGEKVPGDMVTTSASGLDPDISPENAARQVARVAAARHLPVSRVAAVVAAHTEGPLLGLLGAPRVNVLEVNLALDALPGA